QGFRLAHLGGWADIGNLHVDEAYRRRGVATWLFGEAADWLRLARVERLLDYAWPKEEPRLALLRRLGFRELTRTARGWTRTPDPPPASPQPSSISSRAPRSSGARGPRWVPAIFWVPPEASRAGSVGAVSAPMAPVSRAGTLPSSPPSVSYSPTAPGPFSVPGTCSTMSSAQEPVSKGSGSASGRPPGGAGGGAGGGGGAPPAPPARAAP